MNSPFQICMAIPWWYLIPKPPSDRGQASGWLTPNSNCTALFPSVWPSVLANSDSFSPKVVVLNLEKALVKPQWAKGCILINRVKEGKQSTRIPNEMNLIHGRKWTVACVVPLFPSYKDIISLMQFGVSLFSFLTTNRFLFALHRKKAGGEKNYYITVYWN